MRNTDPMSGYLSHSEIEAQHCPAGLRDFLMICAGWEKDGQSGRTEKEFNNPAGRRRVVSHMESLMIELPGAEVFIVGVKLRPDEDPKAVMEFLKKHGIPDGVVDGMDR